MHISSNQPDPVSFGSELPLKNDKTVAFIHTPEGVADVKACYGQDLTQAQKEMVANGAKYFDELRQNPDAVIRSLSGQTAKQVETRLRCMMWYMDVDSLRMHGASDHSRHAMHTFSDQDNVFYDFVEECGKRMPGKYYHRLSTHYAHSRTDDPQRGINLERLPFDLKAILIGHRVDGSTFVKLEDHGCAPVWDPEFFSPKATLDFLGHSVGYIESVALKQGLKAPTKKARREGATAEEVKLFKKLYVSQKKGGGEPKSLSKSEIRQYEKEASAILKQGAEATQEQLYLFTMDNNMTVDEKRKAFALACHLSHRLNHDEEIGADHVLRQQHEIIHNFGLDEPSRVKAKKAA